MEEFFAVLADQWVRNTATDVSRYAIFSISVWLVLWVLLGPVLKNRKIRPETPPTRQLFIEFMISVRSVMIFATISLLPFVLERAGWLKNHEIATAWGPIWFWTSLVLMIIAHDAYFYWSHRIMHDPRLFRRVHRRHHLSHNPSPFSAYSFDLAEAAVMVTFVQVWVLLIPTPWPAVGLFVIHQIIRNTLGHSGYELMPAQKDGRPHLDFLTTTTHHDLHHSEARYNYGLYFTWWDRWMGTEHPEYHARFAAAVRRKFSNASSVAPALVKQS